MHGNIIKYWHILSDNEKIKQIFISDIQRYYYLQRVAIMFVICPQIYATNPLKKNVALDRIYFLRSKLYLIKKAAFVLKESTFLMRKKCSEPTFHFSLFASDDNQPTPSNQSMHGGTRDHFQPHLSPCNFLARRKNSLKTKQFSIIHAPHLLSGTHYTG